MDQETLSLFQNAQAGVDSAFHNIVEKHDWYISSIAMKFANDEKDIQHIYQQLFEFAYNNIGSFRFDRDFNTWLNPILFKIIFELESSPTNLESDPLISDTQKLLNQLTYREKMVFILKHYEKRSLNNIATLLEQRISTIKQIFCSAVEKIVKLSYKMKTLESIPSRLKEQSILKIYNELTLKQDTRFSRQFNKHSELQKYISELQQILQVLPHISEATPAPELLTAQRHIFKASIKSKTIKTGSNNFFSLIKNPVKRHRFKSRNWGRRIAIIGFFIIALGLAIPFVFNKSAPIKTLINKSLEYQIRLGIDQKDINPENIKYSKSSSGYVSFTLVWEKELTYTAKYKDQLARDLICYLLINSKNPGKRLQSVKHLKEMKPDIKVTSALITTLLSDPNSGIRLKSIRILNTYPIDETINQACMKVLLEDQNNTVRMEALTVLSEDPGENLLPILQVVAQLDNNEYIRNKAAQMIDDINETS